MRNPSLRFKLHSLVLLAAISVAGCAAGIPPATHAALTILGAFTDAISLFDKANDLYAASVNAAVTPLRQELKKEGTKNGDGTRYTINLADLAGKWEASWNAVGDRTTELQENAASLKDAAEPYFEQLKTNTEGISDQTRRAEEQKKNEALRARWDSIIEEVDAKLKNARAIHQRGSDFHRILVNNLLRREISKVLETLESLSQEVSTLATELTELAAEARKIAGQSSDPG